MRLLDLDKNTLEKPCFPTSDIKTNAAWKSYLQNKKKKNQNYFLAVRVLRNIVFHITTDIVPS